MKRVVFELQLGGGSASADTRARRWHIVKRVRDDDAAQLLAERSYTYRWDDGWFAFITVRAALPRERVKSDGFSGYGWMVDNILRYGSPYKTGLAEGMAGGKS